MSRNCYDIKNRAIHIPRVSFVFFFDSKTFHILVYQYITRDCTKVNSEFKKNKYGSAYSSNRDIKTLDPGASEQHAFAFC
jgi:hypothetical protein